MELSSPEVFPVSSITKSLVSLVIGALADEGLLNECDRMSRWIPEWVGDSRDEIRLRHLLDQSSGLRAAPKGWRELPDHDAAAAALPLEHPPGRRFDYSNLATQLLSKVIRGATGRLPEDLLNERLLEPLGIAPRVWQRDRVGNPLLYSGLEFTRGELYQIGHWVLQAGSTSKLVQSLSRPGKRGYFSLWNQLPSGGFYAWGWPAQYLVLIPDARAVAVRLERPCDLDSERFADFPETFEASLQQSSCSPPLA